MKCLSIVGWGATESRSESGSWCLIMEFSLSAGSENHEDEKVIDSSENSRCDNIIPTSRDLHGAAKRMLFDRLGVDSCLPHDNLTSPFSFFSFFSMFLRNYALILTLSLNPGDSMIP